MSAAVTKWREVSLGEVCEFKYGKSLREDSRTGGNVPVFGSNGIVGHHDEAITIGPTIVIGRKGSFGEVNYSPVACWPIDTTYYVDESATGADLRWLAYSLLPLGLTKLNRAAAVPGLNREDAYRTRLLLPPLAEQRRIAEVLDRAEALRTKRRATLAQLDALTQSIFLDLFGDPLGTSGKLQNVPFGSVTRRITYGFTSPMKHMDTGIPIVTAKNVRDESIDFDKVHYADESEFRALTTKSKPERGDVLVTKDGTIGRSAVVDTDARFCINQSVALVQPAHEKVLPVYLVAYLSSRRVQHVMQKMGKGNALAHLQITELADLPIPLPPIALQREFAHRTTVAQKLKAVYRASLAGLDALFATLQHRAFRGEL